MERLKKPFEELRTDEPLSLMALAQSTQVSAVTR
jgi:hypothetical protein